MSNDEVVTILRANTDAAVRILTNPDATTYSQKLAQAYLIKTWNLSAEDMTDAHRLAVHDLKGCPR